MNKEDISKEIIKDFKKYLAENNMMIKSKKEQLKNAKDFQIEFLSYELRCLQEEQEYLKNAIKRHKERINEND